MAELALILYVVYLAIAFGARTDIQVRRTGSTGFHGTRAAHTAGIVLAAERTELVTSGPFALVRNPIFSAMLPTALGLALMVPNRIAIAGWPAWPWRSNSRSGSSRSPTCCAPKAGAMPSYAARVGRFLPGVGRIRPG